MLHISPKYIFPNLGANAPPCSPTLTPTVFSRTTVIFMIFRECLTEQWMNALNRNDVIRSLLAAGLTLTEIITLSHSKRRIRQIAGKDETGINAHFWTGKGVSSATRGRSDGVYGVYIIYSHKNHSK